MSGERLDLASEFPEPSRADWMAAVEKVLRGRPFESVLVSTTRDGLDVQPLYTAADAPAGTAAVPAGPRPHRPTAGMCASATTRSISSPPTVPCSRIWSGGSRRSSSPRRREAGPRMRSPPCSTGCCSTSPPWPSPPITTWGPPGPSPTVSPAPASRARAAAGSASTPTAAWPEEPTPVPSTLSWTTSRPVPPPSSTPSPRAVRSLSTAPATAMPGPPRPRSSAGRSPPASPPCGRSSATASILPAPPARSPSASPPAPTSSPPSPCVGPAAVSGAGCSTPAGWPPTGRRWRCTRSPLAPCTPAGIRG